VLDDLRDQRQQEQPDNSPAVVKQLSQAMPAALVDAVGSAVLDSLEEEAKRQVRAGGAMLLAPGQPAPPPPLLRSKVEAAVGAAVLDSLRDPKQQQNQHPEQVSAAVGAAALEDMRLFKQAQCLAAAGAVGAAALDILQAQQYSSQGYAAQSSQPVLSRLLPVTAHHASGYQITNHALTLREQLEKLLDQQDIEASHKRLRTLQKAKEQIMKGNAGGGIEGEAYLKDKKRQQLFHSKIAFPASGTVLSPEHLNQTPSPHQVSQRESQQQPMPPPSLSVNVEAVQNQRQLVESLHYSVDEDAVLDSHKSAVPSLPEGPPPAAALSKGREQA
jgi:hypothetical protein